MPRFRLALAGVLACAGLAAAQEDQPQASPAGTEARLSQTEARLAETEARLAETEARLQRLEEARQPAPPPDAGEPGETAPEQPWYERALRTAAEQVELHGELVGSFVWNLNDPPGRRGRNALRVSDLDHDTFSVTWAKLGLSRQVSGEDALDWGFSLEVAAGRMVQGTLSLDPDFLGGEAINLANAWVELQVPTPHHPLTVRLGRAYGWFGVESLDLSSSQTFSLSWLANFTPYTNTGLFVETELFAGVRYMQYVGNGAEVVNDNNDAKTVGGQLSASPLEQLSLSLNWIWGAERADNVHDHRLQLELDAVWQPTARTSIYLMLHYGLEQHGAVDGRTAKFGGASLALRQGVWRAASGDFDHVVLLARWTIFRDQGGNNSGQTQTLNELTAGVELDPLPPLWIRLEGRLDSSTEENFLGKRGLPTRRQQATLALAVGAHF